MAEYPTFRADGRTDAPSQPVNRRQRRERYTRPITSEPEVYSGAPATYNSATAQDTSELSASVIMDAVLPKNQRISYASPAPMQDSTGVAPQQAAYVPPEDSPSATAIINDIFGQQNTAPRRPAAPVSRAPVTTGELPRQTHRVAPQELHRQAEVIFSDAEPAAAPAPEEHTPRKHRKAAETSPAETAPRKRRAKAEEAPAEKSAPKKKKPAEAKQKPSSKPQKERKRKPLGPTLPDWLRGPVVDPDAPLGTRIAFGLLRRLYLALRILPRVALLLPIPLFMLYVNYNVDRSGLFQGALAPRRIVDLMLQGYDVTNFEQMNEREVVQLFAQDVPETPQAIGIGSSRILQFTTDIVGTDSFFNMGVTGADVRDNMTSYYKMVSYGKAPEVLLWSLDPWVFYGSEDAFDSRADADLYNEFLTKVLNVPTDYEEPDQMELWTALIDPAYFQGNVDYYLKNKDSDVVTDDEGNVIEFNPVEGDPYDQTATIKRHDGSVLYDTAFRNQTEEEILMLAAGACMSFNSVHMEGFEELSDIQCQAFDAFIKYAQQQGTTVILILSPWHPYLYEYLCGEPELHTGFFQVENWVRQYCADNNVPIYGSYDPQCIDELVGYDFFDGLHCKDTGILKFFPGVPQTMSDLQNGTLPDPLAVHPRTSLLPPGEQQTEGEAPVEGESPAEDVPAAV